MFPNYPFYFLYACILLSFPIRKYSLSLSALDIGTLPKRAGVSTHTLSSTAAAAAIASFPSSGVPHYRSHATFMACWTDWTCVQAAWFLPLPFFSTCDCRLSICVGFFLLRAMKICNLPSFLPFRSPSVCLDRRG